MSTALFRHWPGDNRGEFANLAALIESVFQHNVGLELDRVRLVNLPPQELVALQPGCVAGFG